MKEKVRASIIPIIVVFFSCIEIMNAYSITNQFRGVNWADSRDNFQSGVIYVSGLTSSDTYSSAAIVAERIMDQFVSKIGANSVRLPINVATVSQYWGTYTGAIDTILSKGMVILCYWSTTLGAKPADMNAFWSMWQTVVNKYGSNANCYFEIYNEPNGYSKTDLGNLYNSWLTQFATVTKGRVILDGTGMAQNVSDIGSDSRFDGCLIAVHEYSMWGDSSWLTEQQWISHFQGEVGGYSSRTICTEWGYPNSPGSKNGISYDYLDYSKTSTTNYFICYARGVSAQLNSWSMGSMYWPGLRDGDWYSMTQKTGSGSGISLSIPNASGLALLNQAWGGSATIAPTAVPTIGPTPVPGTVSIACGSTSAVGDFQPDQYFSGGSTFNNTNTIDVSGLGSNPPPAALFNNERYGAMSYTIPGFTAGNTYAVTLYFAETYLTSSGSRLFNVSINGASVLSDFDIYASAGGQNKAIAKSFAATADSSGQIVIQFTAVTENPKINGISIQPGASPTAAPTAEPVSLGDVNGSGTVDIVDALLIAQYYVGLNPSGFVASNADVNCSSTIDIVDALLVAQYYVGLIASFMC
jgi:hypothetical protein